MRYSVLPRCHRVLQKIVPTRRPLNLVHSYLPDPVAQDGGLVDLIDHTCIILSSLSGERTILHSPPTWGVRNIAGVHAGEIRSQQRSLDCSTR